nr:uncharacterized protein LOC120284730 [Drosophila simulans]
MLRQLTRSMGLTSRLLRQVNYGTSAPAGTHIPVTKALEIGQWEEKLKAAGVEDTKFNVKCIVSHVLKQKFSAVPDSYDQLQLNPGQLADLERFSYKIDILYRRQSSYASNQF